MVSSPCTVVKMPSVGPGFAPVTIWRPRRRSAPDASLVTSRRTNSRPTPFFLASGCIVESWYGVFLWRQQRYRAPSARHGDQFRIELAQKVRIHVGRPVDRLLERALLHHELGKLVHVVHESVVEGHVVADEPDHRQRLRRIALYGGGPDLGRLFRIGAHEGDGAVRGAQHLAHEFGILVGECARHAQHDPMFASPLALLTSLMLVPVLIARVVNGASQAKASMSPWTSASTISGGARSTIGTSEGARPPEAR